MEAANAQNWSVEPKGEKNSICSRCQNANTTPFPELCDRESLLGFICHHFESHLLNPSDCHKVSISKLIQFIQGRRVLM
jgi:hypothetical protein